MLIFVKYSDDLSFPGGWNVQYSNGIWILTSIQIFGVYIVYNLNTEPKFKVSSDTSSVVHIQISTIVPVKWGPVQQLHHREEGCQRPYSSSEIHWRPKEQKRPIAKQCVENALERIQKC